MNYSRKLGVIAILIICTSFKSDQKTKIKPMNKKEIIYVYDALCGWCFGFSDIIIQFANKHKDEYTFKVISGGLITGDRVGPIGEMSDYILGAIPNLEKTSGKKIGQAYIDVLKERTRIQNSLIPSTALCILKSEIKNQDIYLAHEIQELQFVKGLDLSLPASYKELCIQFNINFEEFSKKLFSPEYISQAEAEFNLSSRLGVRGFPAVVLDRGDTLFAISNGFVTLKDLEKNLDKAISNID